MSLYEQIKAGLGQLSDVKELIKVGGIPAMSFIVFAETGLLFGFFLPGDSMIVVAGIFTSANQVSGGAALMDPWSLTASLVAAAIVGNEVGRWLGHKFGERVEGWSDGWLYKRRYLEATRAYYARKGASSLVLARYIPIIRTFIPFVAGMGQMPAGRFLAWNVVGAVLWIGSLVGLGHFIGNTPLADNLGAVIGTVIGLSFLPVVWKLGRGYFSAPKPESKT
jgi:membrane-associated protein